METEYNDFCLFCIGTFAPKSEIDNCSDTNCPFHPFKFGGLEPDIEQEIVQKILEETHVKPKERE